MITKKHIFQEEEDTCTCEFTYCNSTKNPVKIKTKKSKQTKLQHIKSIHEAPLLN